MKLCYFLLSLLLVSSSSAKAKSYDSDYQRNITNPSEEDHLDFSLVDVHTNEGRPKTLLIFPEAFIFDNVLHFRNGCCHAQLRILASDGMTVVLSDIINNGDTVSVQNLPSGIYCIQIIRDSCTFAAIINVR